MSKLPSTGLLLFAFNRPELTAKVLNQISLAWQGPVVVLCDGPRSDNETDKVNCSLVREVCVSFSKKMELEFVFHDQNKGLKNSIVFGLGYGFSKFEELIILEDDCLPDESFFPFCLELLKRFETNLEIGMIQAGNHLGAAGLKLDSDYYLSDRPKIWGWATWKSRWEGFDPDMNSWFQRVDKEAFLESHGFRGKNLKRQLSTMAKANLIDTWDYQWVYHLWNKNMLSIAPRINLVRNLGFGDQATHTVFVSHLAELESSSLTFPLRHPGVLGARRDLDLLELQASRSAWFEDLATHPFDFARRILKYIIRKSQRT